MSKLGGRDELPTWDVLKQRVSETAAGKKFLEQDAERQLGRGLPHRTNTLRLFSAKAESEVRVKLYRDTAAWCPYCQKVWILLEEKRIPYKVELINMRSYGDKPQEFLQKCPRGLLPAVELDGRLYTESRKIMAMLDAEFSDKEHRPMLPPSSDLEARKEVEQLLQLERHLFAAWCGYVFREGHGGRAQFEEALTLVDSLLGSKLPSSWFLKGFDGPSLVDLEFVTHIERMAASAPYWKGFVVRGSGKYPNIDRWFEAFELLPSYMATKSDWYTHIKDIPPQYGDGCFVPEARRFAGALDGNDAAWRLPLPSLASSTAPSDVLQPGWIAFETDAAVEAAYRIVLNHSAVARFMARGAGTPGHWALGRPDRAKLSDPYAQPAAGDVATAVDAALRAAVAVLLDGAVPAERHVRLLDVVGPFRSEVSACAAYLRDRVGVPRDMSYPAARCLRGSLNWIVSNL